MWYVLGIAAIFMGMVVFCKPHYRPVSGKIVKVGGCDHYGECGVLLDNGMTCEVRFPVEGQQGTCYIKQ